MTHPGRTKIPEIRNLDPTLRMLGLDVVLIQHHHAKALERIGEAMPGFSTGHDAPGDGEGGSITERLALAPDDRAQTDLERMRKLLASLSRDAHDFAELCRSWAEGTVGGVKAAGKDDDDIWCPNCQTHGHHEPRAKDRKLCLRCDGVKRDYGALPNAALYKLWSYKQRLGEEDYVKALGAKRRSTAA